jgi:hypothetical protein
MEFYGFTKEPIPNSRTHDDIIDQSAINNALEAEREAERKAKEREAEANEMALMEYESSGAKGGKRRRKTVRRKRKTRKTVRRRKSMKRRIRKSI